MINLENLLNEALPFIPASNTYSIESDFKVAESISVKSGSSLSYSEFKIFTLRQPASFNIILPSNDLPIPGGPIQITP